MSDDLTPAIFRVNFPAFSSERQYPNGVISFYLAISYMALSASRWSGMYAYGRQLFTAHNLVLEYQAQTAASAGAPPGLAGGPIGSKGGGPLSISWDTGSAAEPNAGHWNYTTYGQRYIRMARLMGAGGLQLGIGTFPPLSGPAWTGPPTWPGWFSS
jgi:hypothetical protein